MFVCQYIFNLKNIHILRIILREGKGRTKPLEQEAHVGEQDMDVDVDVGASQVRVKVRV